MDPYGSYTNSYIGGPNITPSYNRITGDLLQSTRSDSSSASETDSSPGHGGSSINGFHNDLGNQGKDTKKESRRLNKDEKIARAAGIRFNIKQDIINPPMDEFNDMLSKEDLTEEQLNICRDIRRRGKNKVAAQNCRKRKLEQIDELQTRLEGAKRRQFQLETEHKKLLSTYADEAKRLIHLQNLVLSHYNKSSQDYIVQVTAGEEVNIVPRSSVPENEILPRSVESLQQMHGRQQHLSGYNYYNMAPF